MNWDQIQGNWKMMQGKAKIQWGKLSDDDLAKIDGHRDELVGRIQKVYGVSREEAEAQVDRFTHTLQ
jgi:uncharacterized protein YjbJ (UPF0337 family)